MRNPLVVSGAAHEPTDTRRAILPTQARIELLGSPQLVMPQRKPHVLERRDAALLAWLVLHGPTPRGRIVNLLWPDVTTQAAQSHLRQRLFRLKRQTGSEIVVSDPLLALANGVAHDLAPESPAFACRLLNGADQLLGLLDYGDCGELGEWVAAARERWQAGRRERLAEHAAQLEARGCIAEALVFAELHRQVAQWLQRSTQTGLDSSAARTAAHWQAAQEWAQAAPCFEQTRGGLRAAWFAVKRSFRLAAGNTVGGGSAGSSAGATARATKPALPQSFDLTACFISRAVMLPACPRRGLT